MIIPHKKKKLKNEEKNSLLLYFALGIVILILFVFFQPKIASHFFPQKRAVLLKTFLADVEKNKQIDPQTYWEFREFYSPGTFDFSVEGLNKELLINAIIDEKINPNKKNIDRIFLHYRSPLLVSYDMLTTNEFLKDVVIPSRTRKEILFQNPSTIIYRDVSDQQNKIHIIFIKSLDEMKTANGFFDYRDIDKELVKDKNWVNVTTIQQ